MKVKIFEDHSATHLEEVINDWFEMEHDNIAAIIEILQTESEEAIIISIWYTETIV